MCPAGHGMIHSADPCRHPTVHSRKLGDTASHSSLSSCGLALLTVAHQALTIISVGNIQWKRLPLHISKHVVFLSFSPIQQCRSSWWSLLEPLPERSHHLGHGLSCVLSLVHSHTCHQELLNRVTACVSHTEITTKFCGCGISRMHYLGQCCQTAILHCTACCANLN